MALQKNKVYRAEIMDYTTDGSGIARIDGMAVFVPNTAVHDQCDIRIVKVNKKMAFGRVERIIIDSHDRIEPECPIAGKCGGCCYQHISYEAELCAKFKKVEDALTRLGGVSGVLDGITGAEHITRYRNKAQYPVGQDVHGTYVGFYRPHSHDIVRTKDCMIQSERANRLAQTVCDWMDAHGILAYEEQTHKGLIRHIYVRTGAGSGETHLCLVATRGKIPEQEDLIQRLISAEPSLVGIVVNINKRSDNVILGEHTLTLWGEPVLQDSLCGNVFRLSPHAFYQVNHAQTERLYTYALEQAALTGEETVIDLYCGAGTITLALATKAKRVIGVEIVPEAIENAKENAARNGVENVEFLCADAGQAVMLLAERGERPDVLTVDPPRKGLDEQAVAAICQMQPPKIVYVSCDPATLARDVKRFTERGYQVVKAHAFDLFPRTKHVETVVKLSLKKDTPKIEVTMEPDEGSNYTPEEKATYQKIKDYVKDKYGVNVHTSYIAQVKRMCGLDMGENYNKSKKENPEVKQCPQEKVEYIKDALKHFKLI